ncbi:MAG: DUF1523 family protein [Alphaproteobacteria bacterium]
MRTAKWTLIGLVLLAVAGFLHWSLPSRDVVRILGTEVQRRTDGTGAEEQLRVRDVRYIKAVTPDGDPRVYRNEDTDWGWPPYFKFNSANLGTMADDATSSEADPRWMVVRHYGWRIPMLSAFPNALSLRPAPGPDVLLIPWTSIVVIVVLLTGTGYVWLRLRRWWHRRRG